MTVVPEGLPRGRWLTRLIGISGVAAMLAAGTSGPAWGRPPGPVPARAQGAPPSDPYAQAVLADTPVAYLRLAETNGGIAHDSSGNGNDGSYAPGMGYGAHGALLSDSGDTAATMPAFGWWITQSADAFPAGDAHRTVEFWARTADPGGSPTLTYGGSDSGEGEFRVQLTQSQGAAFLSLATGPDHVASADLPHPWWDGSWHMYDVTYDGTAAMAYMDGQAVGSFAVTAPLATTTPATDTPGAGMRIGQLRTQSPVGMDEVGVYPSALSPHRIAAHWSTGASGSGACHPVADDAYGRSVVSDAPALYLRLGDLVGDASDRVAYDASGHCTPAAPANGAYLPGVSAQAAGGLAGDTAGAVSLPSYGWWVTQSGADLPAANTARTVEFWARTSDPGGLPTFRYGGAGGGAGDEFEVQLTQTGGAAFLSLSTDANDAATVGLPHSWWDGDWHLYDVTYDGTTATAYMDGQVAGSFALTAAPATAVPGDGLRIGQLSTNSPVDVAEAAVYPTALSPHRIDAHWSNGRSGSGPCGAAATAPYAKSVLSDAPALYLRLGDLAGARLAYDSSGRCTAAAPTNAAYLPGASAQPVGALLGDSAAAVSLPSFGWWVTQSGADLPVANTARTVEFWARTSDPGGLPTFRYGGAGDGTFDEFAVQLTQSDGAAFLSLTTDATHTSAIPLPHVWWDGNWHLYDVTYDGTHALGYMDGQAISHFAVSGPLATAGPGDGMRMGQRNTNSPVDVQEAAVYPTALPPQRITAHWEAQYLTPPGRSAIAGAALLGSGGVAQGARVQACPTSGADCTVDPDPVDSSGRFHFLVPDGTFTVTVFPPAGSPSEPRTIGPLTVPPSAEDLEATFSPPGGLPAGVTFSAPSSGNQENKVPNVNWGEPSTLTVHACQGGFGVVFVHATNSSTGQSETLSAKLVETPAGSGIYVAAIPPLAPMHGAGDLDPQVTCPGHTTVLPDGGPPGGGTTVLLSGSGFTGAGAVAFGGVPARSFTVLSDSVIEAVSPAGTGSVPVTVTTASTATIHVGDYDYFDVTGVSPNAGPATGGNTVTIHGHGFTKVTAVLFGLLPAPSVTFVNSGEVQAVAPPGLGTVNVEVVNGFAASQPAVSLQYTFQDGPPGSASISEPVSGGDTATAALAGQLSRYCAGNDCGGPYAPVGSAATEYENPPPAGSDDAEVTRNDNLNWANFGIGAAMAACAPILGVDVACAVAGVGALIGSTVFAFLDNHKICIGFLGHCGVGIDPSGTVVDGNGNPIEGATATILHQAGDGRFTPVDPAGGAIEPNVNPQITTATGAFDWDALAGTYEVEASAAGCHAPGDTGHANVFTAPFTLPPPVVGLVLTLDCPGKTPAPPAPTVTAVTPGGGLAAGGNTVDIAGTGLIGATSVRFGDQAATRFTVLSAYAVRATAPAGAGTVDVTVTTPGGTSATGSSDRFAYVSPPHSAADPAVTGVSPDHGPLSGGTAVTIRGSNLDGAYAVSFGGTPATEVTAVSATEVQATAPSAGVPARVDVSVTTPAGASAPTAADLYTYGAPPPPPVPTVTVGASPDPADFHQPVSLTATVSPSDGGGTVAFYDGGSATPISGCGAVAPTSGAAHRATCATSTLAPGDHTITAAYTGDSSYGSATGTGRASIVGSPVSTSPPAISGDTTEGQTLTETHGAWTFAPAGYAYQWQDCDRSGEGCSAIAGAAASTYTLTASDVGHTLRVREVATNRVGGSDPATSAPTGVVASSAAPGRPVNSSLPALSGTPTVGKPVATSTGTWSGTPPVALAYRWQRCSPACADIPDATAATYTPTVAGATLRVLVTATNSAGSAEAASGQSTPVQPSAGQLRAVLAGLLTPAGRAARIGALLKAGGYTFRLAAPARGRAVVVWYQRAKGAHLKTRFVATGRGRIPGRLTVKLTAAGRSLLRRTGAVTLVAKVRFTPAGGAAATRTNEFTVRH